MESSRRSNQQGPSLAQANLLLLVSLALILVTGFLGAGMHFYWTLLIREVLLILGPALLLLLLLRLPWKETLRWPAPGRRTLDWRVLGASAAVGLGGWLFDIWLGTLFGEVLGYTLPLPPDFYPSGAVQALALFGLLAVVAPICEEVLFRGMIQRGYEQLGVWASILLTGLLFMLFHQSLAQGLALVPLAILLSYLAWRTDSLPAAIVAHAANNAPGALLILASTLVPEFSALSEPSASSELSADLTARLSAVSPALCLLPLALFGGLLALGSLWALGRWAPAPPPLQRAPLAPGLGRWLGRTWPLLVLVPVTLLVMGAELLMGRFPELLSMGRPVPFRAAPWEGPQTWRYEVRNVLEERVGTIVCRLEPGSAAYTLTCSRQQSAYEADTGRGVYFGSDLDETTSIEWQRANLGLQRVVRERPEGPGWSSFSAQVQGDAVEVTRTTAEGKQTHSLSLPEPSFPVLPGRARPPTVIEGSEWPWRFSALPFQGFYSAEAALLDPGPPEGGDPTLTHTSVVIYGSEPVATPAGTYIAWRVQVGETHVAWYDAQAPHALVAWEDGVERWVLTSVE